MYVCVWGGEKIAFLLEVSEAVSQMGVGLQLFIERYSNGKFS